MKYYGKITSVSQIDSSSAHDGDVFYVGNDKRFIVYDGEARAWGPFEGDVVELISNLGNTIATIFTEPLDTSGVVEDITDLPLSKDTPAWACYRVPKYNICLVNSDEFDGWLLYVENYGNLKVDDVVDNCESEDTDKPLSANQGRILYGMANGALKTTDVVNDLTSDDTDAPLSAAQGKALKGMIDGVETALAAI